MALTRERWLLILAAVGVAVMVALLAITPSAFTQAAAPDDTATDSPDSAVPVTPTALVFQLTLPGPTNVTVPLGTGDNESMNFLPANVTVVVGVNNTIVWSNLDPAQHNVVATSVPAGAQRFRSGLLNQGQTFTVTLTVPGTYRYLCSIHPDWMRGTIVVKTRGTLRWMDPAPRPLLASEKI